MQEFFPSRSMGQYKNSPCNDHLAIRKTRRTSPRNMFAFSNLELSWPLAPPSCEVRTQKKLRRANKHERRMQMKCAARKLSTTRNKSRLFNKYDKTHQNVRSRKLPAHLPSKMVLKEDQLLRYKVVEAPHTLYVHGVLPCVEASNHHLRWHLH